MSRWFRLYNEVLDDPKVQKLSGPDFKLWVNVLCLAARHDGRLPPESDVGFALRLEPKATAAILLRLSKAGLIDMVEGVLIPHGWNDRQYKSDVSTDRVKRFRKRSGNVSLDVSKQLDETPPETEADTETEVTLAKAKAEPKKSNPETIMFAAGLELLMDAGKSNSAARSIIGKWKRDHSTEAVIVAMGKAKREGAIDPVSFIEGCFRRERADRDEGFSIGGTRMNSPC
jgi:hypothetical protein